MARKDDLIADLNALSVKLDRDLDTSGTIAELEVRLSEGSAELAELALPNGPDDLTGGSDSVSADGVLTSVGGDNTGSDTSAELSSSIVNAMVAAGSELTHSQRRFVKLRNTLHIRHYKKPPGRASAAEQLSNEIVIAGETVRVDAEEAASLIASGDADAV